MHARDRTNYLQQNLDHPTKAQSKFIHVNVSFSVSTAFRQGNPIVKSPHYPITEALLGTENTVARITKARKDIVLLVHTLVKRREIDVNIGVLFLNRLHTLWRCHQ